MAMVALRLGTIVVAMCGASSAAFAGDAGADKSQYTLFNPAPGSAMREMSTDRPDKTESPYTVDAGHIQIETDLVAYTRDTEDGVTTETLDVVPFNFKVGLTNSSDVQFVYGSFSRVRVEGPGGFKDNESGAGDLVIRYKQNFWGNDGGKTAFGIMPFVKIPTSTFDDANDDVEGGVILPLAIDLGNGMGLGLMTEVDILRDGARRGYEPTFINSATLSFELTKKLGLYTEVYTERSAEDGAETVVTLDAGLTYAMTDNLQLDTGVNVGVTDAADDLNIFAGLSRRF
ncbi:MAG: transporter [Hyphomicrobiaceae bacterium]|nr:transporter [Hyphomicrobiaceae bacterium]